MYISWKTAIRRTFLSPFTCKVDLLYTQYCIYPTRYVYHLNIYLQRTRTLTFKIEKKYLEAENMYLTTANTRYTTRKEKAKRILKPLVMESPILDEQWSTHSVAWLNFHPQHLKWRVFTISDAIMLIRITKIKMTQILKLSNLMNCESFEPFITVT